MIMKIVIVSVFIAYILFTFYVNNKINKAVYFDEERRSIHKKLIWILPFIGSLMIRNFWKKQDPKDMKVISKTTSKKSKMNFTESGKGIFG